jgi:hypothetical protein
MPKVKFIGFKKLFKGRVTKKPGVFGGICPPAAFEYFIKPLSPKR